MNYTGLVIRGAIASGIVLGLGGASMGIFAIPMVVGITFGLMFIN